MPGSEAMAAPSSPTDAVVTSASGAVSVEPAPVPVLLDYETLRLSHRLLYSKEEVWGFLTSHRLLLLSASSGKTLFSIPLSIISAHNVNAQSAKQPQVLLRIQYTKPQQPAASPAADNAPAAPSHVVLQFTSDTAVQDRLQWKQAIAVIQSRNQQLAAGDGAAAAAGGRATAASSPSSPHSTSVTVKKETDPTAAASTAAAAGPAASQSTSSPPSAASPSSSTRSPTAASGITTTTISMATLELRASLLARQPNLKQLHTDLVQRGLISEEEFWSSPSQSELIRREAEAASHQRVGLSSAMQADILPSVTSSSVHFTVDANSMHAIFLNSPAVHRAYQQLVPTRMTEKEFWTKYFKWRYVHASRSALLTGDDGRAGGRAAGAAEAAAGRDAFGVAMDDAEKRQEEDEATATGAAGDRRVKAIIASRHVDRSVDLTSADADAAVTAGQPSILNHDLSQSESGGKEGRKLSKKARAGMELISRWNRHGMLVLESARDRPKEDGAAAGGAAAADGAGDAGRAVKEEEAKYHRDLSDSLTLKDLNVDAAVHYDVLPLQRRGFAMEGGRKRLKTDEDDSRRLQYIAAFRQEAEDWKPDSVHHALPQPARCLSLLTQLSLSSRAMNRAAVLTQQIHNRQNTLGLSGESSGVDGDGAAAASSSSSSDSSSLPSAVVFSTTDGADIPVPVEFQQQLRKHFLTCQELSRHFYAAFPVTERSREKLERVKRALDLCYQGLLLLQHDCNRQGQTQLVPIVAPILSGIERCHSLYLKWSRSREDDEKLKLRLRAKQQQTPPADTKPTLSPSASSSAAFPPLVGT